MAYKSQLLTAIHLLKLTKPAYPVVAMLGTDSAWDSMLHALLQRLGVRVQVVPVIDKVSCDGPKPHGDKFLTSYVPTFKF